MPYYRLLLLIVLLLNLILVACSSAQQPAGKPVSAKKADRRWLATQNPIAGSIESGRYTSVIGDIASNPSFSVLFPQANSLDSSEVQTKDHRGVNSTFVSFGPALQDKTIYRLTVSTVPDSSLAFNQLASDMVKETAREMNSEFGTEPVQLHQAMISRNKHQALFAVFQQIAANDNSAMKQSHSLTQVVYIVNYGQVVAEFWLTASDQSSRNAVTGRNRLVVIRQEWQPVLQFVDSFHLVDNSSSHS